MSATIGEVSSHDTRETPASSLLQSLGELQQINAANWLDEKNYLK